MQSYQYVTFIIDAVYRILRNLQNLEQDFVTTEVECFVTGNDAQMEQGFLSQATIKKSSTSTSVINRR